MMDTRRGFLTKILSALGLLGLGKSLVEPKPKPELFTKEPVTETILDPPWLRRDWHPADQALRSMSINEDSPMAWMAMGSGRPEGAAPWARERIVPTMTEARRQRIIFQA